jgi:hypothetical protein
VLVELVQALLRFIKNKNEKIILQSIDNLKQVIQFIYKQFETHMEQDYKKIMQQIWVPILNTLASLYADKRTNIQAKSLDILFELLKEYGTYFDAAFW